MKVLDTTTKGSLLKLWRFTNRIIFIIIIIIIIINTWNTESLS